MFRKSAVLVVCAALAACSSPDAPTLCDISHPTSVVLPVGGYASFNVCAVTFPASASTDSSEYLMVAQSAGGNPGASAGFVLQSTTAPAAAVMSPALAVTRSSRPGGAFAAQFDYQMRLLERAPAVVPPGERVVPQAAVAPSAGPAHATIPLVGQTRVFPHVCTNGGCTTWVAVNGVVKAVSGHVAIYVDPAKPGDLSQADYDSLAAIFDQHVYVVDTTAFGREPDTDTNGVVIALLSGIINQLSPTATCFTTGYVAGFFFSPDLDIQVAANYNKGEIMYGLVADTAGLYSCKHPVASVKRLLPPTFLHELVHMINYTLHVRNKRGNAEDIWLDEALAHYGEELGGRSFLPDTVTFNKYTLDDLNDAYQYLQAPQSHFVLSPTDADLSDNGGAWLFLRDVLDQSGDSIAQKVVSRNLVNSPLTGTNNVQAQTGTSFETSIALWSLANWVSDISLAGFNALPAMR
jgi:hypothetical protein